MMTTQKAGSGSNTSHDGGDVVVVGAGAGGSSSPSGVLAFIDVAAGSRRQVSVGFSPPCEGCSRPVETMALLPDEREITLRVFSDRTVVEAYWADGRVAMTTAFSSGGSSSSRRRAGEIAGEGRGQPQPEPEPAGGGSRLRARTYLWRDPRRVVGRCGPRGRGSVRAREHLGHQAERAGRGGGSGGWGGWGCCWWWWW